MAGLIILLVVVGLVVSTAAVLSNLKRGVANSGWRSRAQLGAWVMACSSALLFLGTVLYVKVNGGFAYYDPTLMRVYRYGAVAALAGVLSGLLGVGRVRVAVVGLSGTMLVVWGVLCSSE